MYEPLQFVLLKSQNNGISRNLPAVPKRFMSIITLTSDYGIIDHDVAALKGDLWKEIPDARVVDISHAVSPYNSMQAAYLISRTYRHYPEGSIHFVLVDAQQEKGKPYLLGEIEGHYFLAPDNGIIPLIASGSKIDRLTAIDMRNSEDAKDPHTVYTRVAGHLSRGGKSSVLGQEAKNAEALTPSRPTLKPEGNEVIAHVLHIDTFGNLVTNITRKWVVENCGNKKITVIARNKRITRIVDSYFEGPTEGELFCVYNSDGYLEVAVQKPGGKHINSACSLLGLQVNSNIFIELE
ncbi:SAM-dependent chlorinase/fluorinase [Phaeocystidibacter luteus]|uniref:SAM-dependent chlorinase/fluorinase n=2 Tax=Phaeocystidibacter luteus TaxID=911197 RepID=A0A6N6RD23_9FLAO|nr:SAM-dependent chlorinase/fluorinase [Phaeocystidibacter luteus]